MKIISSHDNKTVKYIKKLHDKKGRDRENAFIVEGEKLVSEAILSDIRVISIIFRGVQIEEYQIPEDTEVVVMTEEIYDSIADTVTPQSVMAIVEKPDIGKIGSNKDKRNGYIVLDSLQDPGNVGTIIRTAEAAGFKGIITVKGTADPFSQKVVRAAAGAVFRIPIFPFENGIEVISYLNNNGIRQVLCDASGNKKHTECDFRGDIAFILGNEGNGLSDYFIKNVEESVAIDMEENSESLNVAIAAAILMFEKRRQEEVIGD